MPSSTDLILAGAELDQQVATYSASQDKLQQLQQAKQQKLQDLSGSTDTVSPQGLATRGDLIAQHIEALPNSLYKPAKVDVIGDGDSMLFRGDIHQDRLGGDPTIPRDPRGWIDSPEGYHGMFSARPKEVARVNRQMREYGLKSTGDVYKDNELVKLEQLYTLTGRTKNPDGTEWVPGPINYNAKLHPMELGSAQYPLGVDVQRYRVGSQSHGRHVDYIRSANFKADSNAWLAKNGYLFVPNTYSDGTLVPPKQNGYHPNKKDSSTLMTTVLSALKQRESKGDYQAVNDYGYVGAYQFGAARLSDLGMVKRGTKNKDLNNPNVWTGKHGITSLYDFLSHPKVQDEVATTHIIGLEKQLKGSATSQSDLLGKVFAAHLLGPTGARNLNKKDANGTSGLEYYRLGAGLVSAQPGITAVNSDQPATDNRGFFDKAGNFISGVAQGALKSGILDTVDVVGEMTGIGDFGTEAQKNKLANSLTDFDPQYSQMYMQNISNILKKNTHEIPKDKQGWFDKFVEHYSGKKGVFTALNNVVSNINGKDALALMHNAVANTDTTAQSVGYMLGLIVGTKGAGLSKVALKSGTLAGDAIKAVKATNNLTSAQKAVQIANITKEAYGNASLAQKALNVLGKNAGLLAINTGSVNNQLDEFKKNTGRSATLPEVAEKWTANLFGLYLDRLSGKTIIKGVLPAKTGEAMANLIKYTPNNVGLKLAQRTLKTGVGLVEEVGTEFTTEGIQQAIQDATQVDLSTKKGQEQFKGYAIDILSAAVAGGGGAVHMASPHIIAGITKPALTKMFPGKKDETAPTSGSATLDTIYKQQSTDWAESSRAINNALNSGSMSLEEAKGVHDRVENAITALVSSMPSVKQELSDIGISNKDREIHKQKLNDYLQELLATKRDLANYKGPESVAKEEPTTEDIANNPTKYYNELPTSTEDVQALLDKISGTKEAERSKATKELTRRLEMQKKMIQFGNDAPTVVKEKLYGSSKRLGLYDYVKILSTAAKDSALYKATELALGTFMQSQNSKIEAYAQARDTFRNLIAKAKAGDEQALARLKEEAKTSDALATQGSQHRIASEVALDSNGKVVEVPFGKSSKKYDANNKDSIEIDGKHYSIGALNGQINVMGEEQKLFTKELAPVLGEEVDNTKKSTEIKPGGSEDIAKQQTQEQFKPELDSQHKGAYTEGDLVELERQNKLVEEEKQRNAELRAQEQADERPVEETSVEDINAAFNEAAVGDYEEYNVYENEGVQYEETTSDSAIKGAIESQKKVSEATKRFKQAIRELKKLRTTEATPEEISKAKQDVRDARAVVENAKANEIKLSDEQIKLLDAIDSINNEIKVQEAYARKLAKKNKRRDKAIEDYSNDYGRSVGMLEEASKRLGLRLSKKDERKQLKITGEELLSKEYAKNKVEQIQKTPVVDTSKVDAKVEELHSKKAELQRDLKNMDNELVQKTELDLKRNEGNVVYNELQKMIDTGELTDEELEVAKEMMNGNYKGECK